jgi:hypothetical protein
MKLRVGDWVQIRSKEEILSTLDKNGRMEGLPFMPQMFHYCGKKFRVYKRAHKTCEWVYTLRSRRLSNAVHLELRCDGEAYGGCQTACLLYWKEAWVRRCDDKSQIIEQPPIVESYSKDEILSKAICTETDVWARTQFESAQTTKKPKYTCQGTQVPEFTTPLHEWDVRQYIEDYTSGNATFSQVFTGFYNAIANRRKIGLPLRWLYDQYQAVKGGSPYPRKRGAVPAGQPTPTSTLNLQPGEIVRVKSFKEILSTLDARNQNRGLHFDYEMVPYCGGSYRVRTRLNKFIDEKTGTLVTLKKECILLEGVTCKSRFSECRILCPRSIYPWWHEVWLERIHASTRMNMDKADTVRQGLRIIE